MRDDPRAIGVVHEAEVVAARERAEAVLGEPRRRPVEPAEVGPAALGERMVGGGAQGLEDVAHDPRERRVGRPDADELGDDHPAARAHDAPQLGRRALAVEPVPGVGGDRAVDGGVGERDRLGAAREDALGAEVAGEDGPHARQRLDRHDVAPEREQRHRELPGPRAQVQHPRAAHGRGDLARHRLAVARTPALVLLRDPVEAGDKRVQLHSAGP